MVGHMSSFVHTRGSQAVVKYPDWMPLSTNCPPLRRWVWLLVTAAAVALVALLTLMCLKCQRRRRKRHQLMLAPPSYKASCRGTLSAWMAAGCSLHTVSEAELCHRRICDSVRIQLLLVGAKSTVATAVWQVNTI